MAESLNEIFPSLNLNENRFRLLQPTILGHFLYNEKEYRQEYVVQNDDGNADNRYLNLSVDRLVKRINLLDNYDSTLIRANNDDFSYSSDPKQRKFFNWINDHLIIQDIGQRQISINMDNNFYLVDFVVRRKVLSDILLKSFVVRKRDISPKSFVDLRWKITMLKFGSNYFLIDAKDDNDWESESSENSERSYAGIKFEQFVTGNTNEDLLHQNYNVPIHYLKIQDTKTGAEHSFLLSANCDCQYSNDDDSYCEIKSRKLFCNIFETFERVRNFEDRRDINNWWNINNQYCIKLLKLSELSKKRLRITVLKTLFGDFNMKRYWSQTSFNNSKKIICGLYIKEDSKHYILKKILEIDFAHLDEYIEEEFGKQDCLERFHDLFSEIKTRCTKERRQYDIQMNGNKIQMISSREPNELLLPNEVINRLV